MTSRSRVITSPKSSYIRSEKKSQRSHRSSNHTDGLVVISGQLDLTREQAQQQEVSERTQAYEKVKALVVKAEAYRD